MHCHRKIRTQNAYHNIPRVKTQKAFQQLRTTKLTNHSQRGRNHMQPTASVSHHRTPPSRSNIEIRPVS
jgi:hypothetical protein